jgi:hypothetical protein
VLLPGSLPSGSLWPAASAEADDRCAHRAGALDPLPMPVVQVARAPPSRRRANGTPAEPPKIHRMVPVSPAEELDSHFGGLTTRIGRWLESLSVKANGSTDLEGAPEAALLLLSA